ncbi:uncharacterized protein BDR25DRAFT_41267 [Lindgomyces ingoldianus]|uniref:Uncharacterized protein n=1 Tax=Lindgomyces ingoldianus TaxID=673940 RepID=A0ACB6RCH9_9PLEO|nr:uncharacterized protein BDR25DRAFT_41267 [Lindgomyces ingoldianus]KAF2476807.1 hypothetical protein BDR25DRAFT_41267 [Lindgomyces ingoldianus]
MGISLNSRHDSFSQFPPEQRKKKLWDPSTTLDIINPSKGCLTCVGYAPSCGRRCRNPINQANRASAYRLLEDLSYIDASTTDINAKLHQLAGLTLCLRFHQGQKNDIVKKWCRKIDQQQTASRISIDAKVDPNRIEEQLKDIEGLLAHILYKTKGADEFIFSSPTSQHYRKRYDPQSAQEERAQKQREEETRKSRERERENQQQERVKKEREEKEKKKREEEKMQKEEQQAKDREARERQERNERIRQRAEQARKESERKARELAAKEREEWDKVWLHYVLQWDDIKKKDMKGTSENLRKIIPWPVKSGDWRGVSGPAVEDFFRKAPPQTTSAEKMLAIMKMECLKWHTDRVPRMFGVIEDKNLADLFNTVAQVAIKIRAETGRQRER